MQALQMQLEQVIEEHLPSAAATGNHGDTSMNKSGICDISLTKEQFNMSGQQSFDNRNNLSVSSNDEMTQTAA